MAHPRREAAGRRRIDPEKLLATFLCHIHLPASLSRWASQPARASQSANCKSA
jgi:hypothetical protein